MCNIPPVHIPGDCPRPERAMTDADLQAAADAVYAATAKVNAEAKAEARRAEVEALAERLYVAFCTDTMFDGSEPRDAFDAAESFLAERDRRREAGRG